MLQTLLGCECAWYKRSFVLLEEIETENKEFRTELVKCSTLLRRFPILQI
jgi:hypothetical protein